MAWLSLPSRTGRPPLATRTLRVRYPRNWRRVRQQVLERDGYRCQNCGYERHWFRPWDRRTLDVHHIVPLSRGGTNRVSNLTTLCRHCHARVEPHVSHLR